MTGDSVAEYPGIFAGNKGERNRPFSPGGRQQDSVRMSAARDASDGRYLFSGREDCTVKRIPANKKPNPFSVNIFVVVQLRTECISRIYINMQMTDNMASTTGCAAMTPFSFQK